MNQVPQCVVSFEGHQRSRRSGALQRSALMVALAVASPLAFSQSVPAALNEVNATLNALIATVNQLKISVDKLAPSPPSTTSVLFAPSVSHTSGYTQKTDCRITNVGPSTLHTVISVINFDGTLAGSK